MIWFVESKFRWLFPAHRYHALTELIPKEFFDEHLANAKLFPLAPGEKPEELRYPDERVIQAITPDVMKALVRSGAIEALDELMCPIKTDVERAVCYGDYRHSREVLRSKGFGEEELFEIFHVLMAKGGFCDCEILYNVAQSSRLKAEYWRASAGEREERNQ